jgi:chromosome segregation ATPase
MNTEKLKELGLTDEQAKSVFALHGEALNQEKSKLQADLDTGKTQIETLTEQLAARDKDLSTLKKSAGDNEELKKQYEDLQTKYKSETDELSSKLESQSQDVALKDHLASSKARDVNDLLRDFKENDVKVVKKADGTYDFSAVDNRVTELQKDKAYYFNEGTQQNYTPNGGAAVNYSSNLQEAMKQEGFNFTEFLTQQKGETN